VLDVVVNVTAAALGLVASVGRAAFTVTCSFASLLSLIAVLLLSPL
jgi:hypothetical protein